MKATLIDFYDSFTNNIASSLLEIGITCKIIKFDEAKQVIDEIISNGKPALIVLGPGPGRASEYECLFETLKLSLARENIFHFGICLGHQIIMSLKGGEIYSSNNPLHGQSEELQLPRWEGWFSKQDFGKSLRVQRYNSLCASFNEAYSFETWFNCSKELMGSRGSNFVTYQFHPESVGTSGQKFLFSPLLKILYNSLDDKSAKDKRTL